MKTILYIFIYSSIGFVFFSCNSSGKERENESEKNTSTRVDGVLVQGRPFSPTVSSTANLLPLEQVELQAPVAGNVMAIHFREGDYVKKGKLLVTIDDRAWVAQLRGLEAQLISARKDLGRKSELLKIQGVSKEEVDIATASVETLEAQIEELKVMIGLAKVRAPFSGTLGMRDFSVGAYLSQGQAITTLVQTQKLKVDFTLPSEYATAVKDGDSLAVIFNTHQDTAVAHVYAIDPSVSLSSRSIRVRALLDNPERRYIPGTFVEVRVPTDQNRNALFVPAESVIPELDAHVVFKVEQGKAKRQPVELGTRTETSVHITSGIEEGDTVLVTGLMEMADGKAVEIRSLNAESL